MKRVKASKKGTDWTPEVEKTFLEALSKRGNIQDGIDATGVSRRAVDYRREKDEEFSAKFTDAKAEAFDRAMAVLHDRGFDGVERTYIRGGKTIIEKQADTPAAQLWLRKEDPATFGGRLELTGKDGRDIRIKVVE